MVREFSHILRTYFGTYRLLKKKETILCWLFLFIYIIFFIFNFIILLFCFVC